MKTRLLADLSLLEMTASYMTTYLAELQKFIFSNSLAVVVQCTAPCYKRRRVAKQPGSEVPASPVLEDYMT